MSGYIFHFLCFNSGWLLFESVVEVKNHLAIGKQIYLQCIMVIVEQWRMATGHSHIAVLLKLHFFFFFFFFKADLRDHLNLVGLDLPDSHHSNFRLQSQRACGLVFVLCVCRLTPTSAWWTIFNDSVFKLLWWYKTQRLTVPVELTVSPSYVSKHE